MITNLHCNNKCKFCYQKDKSKKILELDELLVSLNKYYSTYKGYEYCTIMGGESTLLHNLTEYIKIGSLYAKETRLTTNGKLLTTDRIQRYRDCGLDGINVSIATLDADLYSEIHGTDIDVNKLIGTLVRNSTLIDIRINVPLCEENCADDYKGLKHLLKFFTDYNFNITMCEDIKGTYSIYEAFHKIGATEMSRTNYGLIFLNFNGSRIGYYTHRNNNYNDTDLVVTPLGTFVNWTPYCEAVGINE